MAIIGPIRQELLSGVREEKQYLELQENLRAFPEVRLETADYAMAARCFNECRARGIQGSNTNFLICAVSLLRRMTIFTADKDFDAYRRVLGIDLQHFRKSNRKSPRSAWRSVSRHSQVDDEHETPNVRASPGQSPSKPEVAKTRKFGSWPRSSFAMPGQQVYSAAKPSPGVASIGQTSALAVRCCRVVRESGGSKSILLARPHKSKEGAQVVGVSGA